MTDRCENCDKPTATQADYDTIPEGDGQHLCWSPWNRDRCEEPTQDWRGRALAAESSIREQALRIEGYEREVHDLWNRYRAMYDVVTAAMACRTVMRGTPSSCTNESRALCDAVDEYINRYIVS